MRPFHKATLVLSALCFAMGLSGSRAFADVSSGAEENVPQTQKMGHKKAFILGVCVGENLAKKGITLNIPRGQQPTWDEATRNAVKSALESCRSQMGRPEIPGGTSGPTSPTAPGGSSVPGGGSGGQSELE